MTIELAPKLLKNYPKYLEQPNINLLKVKLYGPHYNLLIEQEPHIQPCVMVTVPQGNNPKSNFDYHFIDLPLPYIYYFAKLNANTLAMQVKKIGCSIKQLKLTKTEKDLYTRLRGLKALPLPNTGKAGYTCAPPTILKHNFDNLNTVLKELNNFYNHDGYEPFLEVSHAIVAHFWQQKFMYYERCVESHKLLWVWSGKEPKDYNLYNHTNGFLNQNNIDVYEKWSTVSIEELKTVPFFKTGISVSTVKEWTM